MKRYIVSCEMGQASYGEDRAAAERAAQDRATAYGWAALLTVTEYRDPYSGGPAFTVSLTAYRPEPEE